MLILKLRLFCLCSPWWQSIEHTAFVGRYHVLDINEGILSSMLLKQLQCLLNKVSQIHGLPLTVHDAVAHILVALLEQVENWQDLAVVGHKSLTNRLGAKHERLEDLERDGDHLAVTGIQCS